MHANGTESWRESVGSVAMVTSRWDGATVTGGVTYLYRGGLGSVEALADLSGSALGSLSYTAFGRLRSAADWGTLEPGESIAGSYGTRQGFTGGQDLASLGVVVLGARVYDPALGRWLSPDPAGMSASPYVYVGDDPEGLTDPTGAFSIGGVVAIAAVVAASVVTFGAVMAAYGLTTMAEIATATGGELVAAGAAAGFAGGFTGGMIGSDGNPAVGFRSGLYGAASGAAMAEIGNLAGAGQWNIFERAGAEGLVNGT
ncbi:MAG: RHS repeat-associated core domain-containing protein, partial [Gammaproteobacteria bacterium]